MNRRVRREVRERVTPFDASVGEEVRSVRAEGERPFVRRADEDPAHMRELPKRRNQLRMPLLDVLERQAVRRLHQVDKPEVPGAEDDDRLA